MGKSLSKIKKRAGQKRTRQTKKRAAVAALHDRLKKSSTTKKKPKKQRLAVTKQVKRVRTQAEIDFVKIAKSHPPLQALAQALPKLGLTMETFLDAIKLDKFLTSKLGVKGNIFEVLVLKDRVMVNLLYQRALGTLKNLALLTGGGDFKLLPNSKTGAAVPLPAMGNAELKKLVLNINDTPFNAKDFDISDFSLGKSGEGLGGEGKPYGLGAKDNLVTDVTTRKGGGQLDLATNFNTIHKNLQGEDYSLLFSDFAMVRFNPKNKKLLILIPGEIKEPAAAKELADQLSKIEARLKGCEAIEFDLSGSKESIRVKPGDVFVVRDNSLGIPRKVAAPTRDPGAGRNITYSGDVLDIVQVNSRNTKGDLVDTQEMFRFSVKVKNEYDPEAIAKALEDIKTRHLKLPH